LEAPVPSGILGVLSVVCMVVRSFVVLPFGEKLDPVLIPIPIPKDNGLTAGVRIDDGFNLSHSPLSYIWGSPIP
jgi:hypothetical protein